MKELNDVTLIAADTYYYGGAVASLKKSMAQCKFGRVVLFTNIPLKLDGIDVIQIPELKGKDGYSEFLLKEAYKYISSDFVLVTQHDSWVLNGDLFDERLYDTDYAGALWLENDGLGNGNGGFSWRSMKLMEAVGEDGFVNATAPEDVALCRVYRRYLEKRYGLIWASDELCEQFSYELRCPTQPTFGFHSYFHQPYQKTVVIIRKDALGDVVMVEPVMKYFYDKGYRIVLDTLEQFKLLFGNHYFKVHFLNQIDKRLIETAKIINLDMSYESLPKQLHLKSYFEYAGVSEEEYLPYLKNPKLNINFPINDETKLFKKYVILHIDKRGQPHRNIENIDWYSVVKLLTDKGYTVLNLGKGEHMEITGAIEMNCNNESFLSYVCAGASLFIGIDSGISNICSGFDIPSIIFFGSVNPEFIHPDLSNKIVITNHKGEGVCDTPYCWHNVIGCEGMECAVNKDEPPCVKFKTSEVISAVKKLTNG